MWGLVRISTTMWWLILTLSGLIIIINNIGIAIIISDVCSIIGLLQSLHCNSGYHSIDLITFVIGSRLIKVGMTRKCFDSRGTGTRITNSRNTTTPSTMSSICWWIGIITIESNFFAHWIKLVFPNDHTLVRIGSPGTRIAMRFLPKLKIRKK